MSEVKKSIEINSPIEKVFKVISDFKKYPKFLPETKDVIIERSTKKKVIASFSLQLFSKINYTLDITLTEPTRISWKMTKGQMMKKNSGSWAFKKISPRKTKATYSIDIEFGALVPKSISDMLVENSLPKMLNNFKKRVETTKG